MFENIGLRLALIMLGTFNQGWLMKEDWKLKLVETIPYLVLALTLFVSVMYEKSIEENVGRVNHGLERSITLKSVVSSEIDR